MEQHAKADVQPGGVSHDRIVGPASEFSPQNDPQAIDGNSARGQFAAKPFLGEIRLATEDLGTLLNRLVKRLLFEGMQRVVMDEDGDRSLRGQEMRGMSDRVC